MEQGKTSEKKSQVRRSVDMYTDDENKIVEQKKEML